MDGAGAAPAPFAPMPSSGSSSSWKAQKNNVLRIVDLTLAVINTSANHPSKGLYPDSFNDFTAEQASNEDVYALFATFVAKEYVTGRGGATEKTFLSPDVAVNYLRTFVQMGKSLFGDASAETMYFFTCVDPHANNPKAAWLRGLIKNVHRCMCQRVCRAADEAQSCRYVLVAWPVTSTRSTAHMRSADRGRRRMR